MTPRALPETGYPAVLWLWPSSALYTGPSLQLGSHSGSVAALAVGDFTVNGRPARSALIAPRVRHQIIALGDRMVFGYLDANSAREQSCRQRMCFADKEISIQHDSEEELAALDLSTEDGARKWLDLAAPQQEMALDARIERAMRWLREESHSAAELADDAGLSESRFLHLFREQTGTSFRRYRLWTRMLRVSPRLARGEDLTTASVGAGFASPSHFSDAFHSMFGLRPSRLLAVGLRIAVVE